MMKHPQKTLLTNCQIPFKNELKLSCVLIDSESGTICDIFSPPAPAPAPAPAPPSQQTANNNNDENNNEQHSRNYQDIIDCNGCILSPGFIDIQINGAHGIDFSNPTLSKEDVLKVAASLPQYGVTSFCPTIITSSNDVYQRNINLISQLCQQQTNARTSGNAKSNSNANSNANSNSDYNHHNHHIQQDCTGVGAKILGIHLEGPFFAKSKRGAHNAQYIKEEVGLSSMNDVYSTSNLKEKNIKIITMAPELPGALSTIGDIDPSIVVAMGHTNASLLQGIEGVKAGATLITHLYNAMKPFHHRDPGLFGLLQYDNDDNNNDSLLELQSNDSCDNKSEKKKNNNKNKKQQPSTDKQPYFSIIVDGLHSHPTSVKMAYKLNPKKLILVTDAMSAMGLGGGIHTLGSMSVTIKNDRATISGTDNILAGSIVSMDTCVRNLCQFAKCSIDNALKAASEHPAKVLHCEDEIGSIRKGLKADLVLIDDDLNVLKTWIDGELVFDYKNRKSRKRKHK